MKQILQKISNTLRGIFGYGVMIVLFAGGLIFFGYLAALVIGGENAAAICVFLYKKLAPVMIYAATCLILLGLAAMYLSGEKALTAEEKKQDNTKL